MKRITQSVEGLLASMSALDTSWEDDHARAVISLLNRLPDECVDLDSALERMLSEDLQVGLTAVRLVMDLSKDEFNGLMRGIRDQYSIRPGELSVSPQARAKVVAALAIRPLLEKFILAPVTWRSILVERLKSGRGSAIKGQRRGRDLEDFVEGIVREVFADRYFARCRFQGAQGEGTEKSDFAIPSSEDPQILIEVKAYGATGSKQTDVLGDIERIVGKKRHDTELLLVTDGSTWQFRVNDLRKLVEMQNSGQIQRIYTKRMADDLRSDLRELKASKHL